MPLPELTADQRREALAKAAQARTERAAAIAALKNGSVTFTAVLDDEDSPLQRAYVRQVLRAVPGVGPVKADRIIAGLGIPAKRRLSGLGPRQRRQLAACLS